MMRTFSEYINEARQNYIFGGTDDRNINVSELKSFGELIEGDTIYISSKYNIVAASFLKLKHITGVDELVYTYKDAKDNYILSLDKTSYDDLSTADFAIANNYTRYFISTDADKIVKVTNNMWGTNFTINDIVDRQKVNEERQNYIFGGSDDRNTNIVADGTKLSNLKRYERIYQWYKGSATSYVVRIDVEKYRRVNGSYTGSSFFNIPCITRDQWEITKELPIHKKFYYESGEDYSGGEDTYVRENEGDLYIICSSKEKFLKLLSDRGIKVDKITDYSSGKDVMNESIQNYIFGGTDNRVPKIGSTPIDALSEGDKIYYWSKSYGREAYECKVTKEEETDGEFAIDVIMDDEKNTLFVYKKFYERGSDVCVCKHDRVFAVFATDEETFLDACNENSIKIDNIVR